MNTKRLLLLDMDGVILNSKENMKSAWADVQKKLKIPVPFDEYFKNIGRPFSEIMKILGLNDNQWEIEEVYKNASLQYSDTLTFYDDVKEVLNDLVRHNIKIGVVTSKDSERTKLILDRLGVKFDIVQTPGAVLRGKPAPDHLLYAMALTKTDPSETIYIGDMDVDYVAAKRAGIDYYHATWGYSANYSNSVKNLNSFREISALFNHKEQLI